ncbi:MAG: anti-sigma factor [Chloroflexota bacterium]|nr:anti-sigma factor [Chloroflexota bacterium]
MAIILPKTVRLGSRAQDFYARFFKPVFESFQSVASRTPLVIMLWGPRLRSPHWSRKRMDVRDALLGLGHSVFFSEQLGVPVAAVAKKGIEFLQSETADLIVVIQPSYDIVGGVRHFVELRVVDSKMVLFIDASAPDEKIYQRAIRELQAHYNNVDTYTAPEDGGLGNLLRKVVEKVSLFQMVKYRAIQNARNWGLKPADYSLGSVHTGTSVHPFHYNLLELYREHRDEIEVLTDPTTLFVLAFVNHAGKSSREALAREINFPAAAFSQTLARLTRAGMMAEADGEMVATGFGLQLLHDIGFSTATPAVFAPRPRQVSWDRVSAMGTGAGIALASVILIVIAIVYGASITQQRAPLELTPAHAVTAAKVTPTQTISPNAIVTPPAH